MPIRVTKFQETPNPNALKCLLDRRVSEGSRSYPDAPSARADPIASRLFQIDGVRNVLLHEDWLTVGKLPEADWGRIRPGVERALGQVDG